MRPIVLTLMLMLMLMLMLLLTGSGEAGETIKIGNADGSIVCSMWIDPIKGLQMEGKDCPNPRPSACEQRMQEAMKAVDPYLPHPPPTMVFDDLIPRYCDQICQAEKALKEAKQKTKVLNQWTSVMHDCVKETP